MKLSIGTLLEIAHRELEIEKLKVEKLNCVIELAEEFIPWYNKRRHDKLQCQLRSEYNLRIIKLSQENFPIKIKEQECEDVRVKVKLSADVNKTFIPTNATDGSAGADVYASESVTIQPNERKLIKTGVSIELPEGYLCYVLGRSGNTIKKGLHVALGLVDSDYRGEIGVMAFNQSNEPISFKKGDRVAQLVILPYPKVTFEEVSELSETERGDGGYGSTGK